MRIANAKSRGRVGRAPWFRAPRAFNSWLVFSSLILLSSSCGRKESKPEPAPLPIGGPPVFAALLDEALRRADPQGVVLVVLWRTAATPPESLDEIIERWGRYGLIPVSVCIDLIGAEPVGADSRQRTIDRIRAWEKSQKGKARGMIYDGDPAVILRGLERESAVPSITLLSEQGVVLWASEGFQGIEELEAMLNVHLGEPSVALQIVAAGARVGRVNGDSLTGRTRGAGAG